MAQRTVQPTRTGALPWQIWQQSLAGETFEFDLYANSKGRLPLSVAWIVNDQRIRLVSGRPLIVNQNALEPIKWHPVVQALDLTITPEAQGETPLNEETIGVDVQIKARFSVDPINRHMLRVIKRQVADGRSIAGVEAS